MKECISALKTLMLFAAILSLILGCKKAEEKKAQSDVQSKKVLARVDGDPIFEGDIVRRIKVAHGIADNSTVNPDQWKRLIEATLEAEIVDRLLLKAATGEEMVADSEGVDQLLKRIKTMLGEQKFQEMLNKRNSTEEEYREFLEQRSLIKQYKENLFSSINIDEDTLKQYYEEHEKSFISPDRVRLEILDIKNAEEADEIYQKVKSGEDFDKVEQDYSSAGKKVTLRKTTLMSADTVPPAVQLQIKGGSVGDIIGPANIDDSIYIFKILEKQQSRVLTYEETKERIRSLLLKRNQQQVLDEWAVSAKKKARIKYIN